MGVGNTLASVVTCSIPIVVAIILEATDHTWTIVFYALVIFNFMGAFVSWKLVSVVRLDGVIMNSVEPEYMELSSTEQSELLGQGDDGDLQVEVGTDLSEPGPME